GPVTCIEGTYPLQCSTRGFGGAGISIQGNNVTVRNGIIKGIGGRGIEGFGDGMTIDSLTIRDNTGDGIRVQDGIISNCRIRANPFDGILFFGAGTVNHNVVNFNGGFGIEGRVDQGGLVASNNSVDLNGQDGLSQVMLAVNNIIAGNVGFGF